MNPENPEENPTLATSEEVELPTDTSIENEDIAEEEMPEEDESIFDDSLESETEDSVAPELKLITPQEPEEPTQTEIPISEPAPASEVVPLAESTEPPSSLDSLAVALTFEVGQKNIPLSELKSLQSGFSFEFENPINAPVTIKANGQPIGTGELLQIGDKVGVRVIEFLSND